MAYGRVNIGGSSGIKEIKIKETIEAPETDLTTKYELIKTQTKEVSKVFNFGGTLQVKNKYASEEHRYISQLFLNDKLITYWEPQSNYTLNKFSTIILKDFNIIKTNSGFNVSIIFNAFPELDSGSKIRYNCLIPYITTFPLTTDEIKLTSKAGYTVDYNGIIEKDYIIYKI